MILREKCLEFNFTDAIHGFKFDEQDRTSPTFHGLSHCMKAVDLIVELNNAYLFVEVKDPGNTRTPRENFEEYKNEVKDGTLRDLIVVKFRDSLTYRWAENKIDKPIYYLNLITLEDALLIPFQDEVRRTLPSKGPNGRWQKTIVCHIVNLDTWNRSFPKWPVRRLSA